MKLVWLLILALAMPMTVAAQTTYMVSIVPTVFNTPAAAPATTVITYNNFPFTHFGGFSQNESQVGNCLGGLNGSCWTVLDWKIVLRTAPGQGASWTFMVRKLGQDTGYYIKISDNETLGVPSTASPPFFAGDVLTVAAIPSMDVAPAPISNAGGLSMVTRWSGPGALECTGGTGMSHIAPGTISYIAPQYGGSGDRLSEFMPWASSGTFCFARVDHDIDLGGVSECVSYRMQVNPLVCTTYQGARDTDLYMQIGTGRLTSADIIHYVHVNRGDIVGWKMVASSGAAHARFRLGYVFVPDNPGECVMTGHFYLSTKQFQIWESNPSMVEPDYKAPMLACTVKNLVVSLTSTMENHGVVSGKQCTQIVRRNSTDMSLKITGFGPIVYWEDIAHSISFLDGDTLNFRFTNVNSAPGWMHYGIAFLVQQ